MDGRVTSFDESVLATFPVTLESLREQGILAPTVTAERLRGLLSPGQQAVFDELMDLRPEDYGVSTPYAGELEPVPGDLVEVTGQRYSKDGEEKTLGARYVPRHVFEAYRRMDAAFTAGHPGRALLIQSCYRSPAYQVAVIIDWLVNAYDGDVAATVRHASPPRYSQHTIASKAAIDFKNVDGVPSGYRPEFFKDTVEYAWLREHGAEFGFHESWQEGNAFGMRAEPWHWQYRPAASA